MGKDMFVTSGLCKIRDQIAASSKKNASSSSSDGVESVSSQAVSETADNASSPEKAVSSGPSAAPGGGKVFDFESLSPEIRKALIQREEEFERFRREALLRLHELLLISGQIKEKSLQSVKECDQAEGKLEELRKVMEGLPALDRQDASYRKQLADNCRKLDQARMEMLSVKILLESGRETAQSSAKTGNLFAELDSVSFSQIFRIAAALSLPLILTLIFCALLVGCMMLLTFRVSL